MSVPTTVVVPVGVKKVRVTIDVAVYHDANDVVGCDLDTACLKRSIDSVKTEFDATSIELAQALMSHLDDELKNIEENSHEPNLPATICGHGVHINQPCDECG